MLNGQQGLGPIVSTIYREREVPMTAYIALLKEGGACDVTSPYLKYYNYTRSP